MNSLLIFQFHIFIKKNFIILKEVDKYNNLLRLSSYLFINIIIKKITYLYI